MEKKIPHNTLWYGNKTIDDDDSKVYGAIKQDCKGWSCDLNH